LRVEEVDGNTAADLRLLGEGVLGDDEKYYIESRFAVVVEVEDGDTLNDVVEKINDSRGFVTASIFDDGSAFNSFRLVLTSNVSGADGRLIVDDSGLNLAVTTTKEAHDALLRIGSTAESGFLVASSTNKFENALTGVDVEVLEPGEKVAEVTISRNTAKTEKVLQGFVDSYNTFIDTSANLTKFDPETGVRGVLQGRSLVLRIQRRLDSLVNRRFFESDKPFQSLVDLGIRVGLGGRLLLDQDRLSEALEKNPQAVADFFLEEDIGFADSAMTTIESLTDPFTGTFSLEENSLQSSIDSLADRIEQLDAILEVRRERMLREFVNLENILGTLSFQQRAIGNIASLSLIPVSTRR
jgi:flagellar hook-associated protein 2